MCVIDDGKSPAFYYGDRDQQPSVTVTTAPFQWKHEAEQHCIVVKNADPSFFCCSSIANVLLGEDSKRGKKVQKFPHPEGCGTSSWELNPDTGTCEIS